MRQSQLLTGISVVWGIFELETSPRNTVDALRFEGRAASYAGSAGFGGGGCQGQHTGMLLYFHFLCHSLTQQLTSIQ